MEKTLGRLFDLNDNLLEAEDGIGLKAGYIKAMNGQEAIKLYEIFNKKLEKFVQVKKGIFGVDMKVNIQNDGPVTIIIESGD